jgi:ubiquinone/menaquinone biosynthesis C-methylase UbiE
VVASYDASQATKIVDVGGSHGILLAALLQAAPTAHGVLFDLPHVLPEAREVVRRLGLQDRIELVGGDCFQEVPPGGDLYLLKQMLECWEDARCTRLLANIARVAKPHSTLLVIERLLPDTPAPSPLFLTDLTMLVLAGGRERSRQEFATLLSSAGYHLERITPTSGPFSVIEATRGS